MADKTDREQALEVDTAMVKFMLSDLKKTSNNGKVMTQIVPDAKTGTLQPIILNNVHAGSEIQSDEWFAYRGLNSKGYTHKTVEHGKGEYAKNGVHVNGIEGYWSILKKGIRSTHIHVGKEYLANYAKEFEYRYNSRSNPSQMIFEMLNVFPRT